MCALLKSPLINPSDHLPSQPVICLEQGTHPAEQQSQHHQAGFRKSIPAVIQSGYSDAVEQSHKLFNDQLTLYLPNNLAELDCYVDRFVSFLLDTVARTVKNIKFSRHLKPCYSCELNYIANLEASKEAWYIWKKAGKPNDVGDPIHMDYNPEQTEV